MNCSEVTRELVDSLPEVREDYGRLKAEWGDEEPGTTIVFEDVLKPLVVSLARSGERASLARVFDFFEVLASDADSHVRDLVAYAVYDLCLDETALKVARKVMGKRTKRICESVARDDYKFSFGLPTT